MNLTPLMGLDRMCEELSCSVKRYQTARFFDKAHLPGTVADFAGDVEVLFLGGFGWEDKEHV